MRLIKVAAATLNQTPFDWDNNFKNIITAIHKAKRLGVSVLCLPELCITGYGCEDAFFYQDVREQALQMLDRICMTTYDITVSVGLPLVHNNALYNVAALLVNGKLKGFVPKQNLCSDGVHYEPRWFKPWTAGIQTVSNARDLSDPIGDLIFDVGGVKIGFEICEDAWVAERPGISLAKRAVDIILNPSASHFAFGKHEIRKSFVVEGSRAFKCVYIYSNLLGNEAGRLIFDGDEIIASNGRLVAQGNRFSFNDYTILSAVVDVDEGRTQQLQSGSYHPSITKEHVVDVPFSYPESVEPTISPAWQLLNKEEEFTKAVSLGLFDYMRKSHTKGFVVSLSGGADSASVACLVYNMYIDAKQELGTNMLSKLGLKPDTTFKDILTCVYQATENSSFATHDAAFTLATTLGASWVNLEINQLVKNYISLGEQAVERSLTWERDDIALQNIQARTRGPGVWLIANLKNALLLTTSNRSEAAVGYCSLDGDTCGGLAPISGIDKTFLLSWLPWLSVQNNIFKRGLAPILSLKPTAELRPGNTQTDEDDLMPYQILNLIEQAAIRDKLGPRDVFTRMRKFTSSLTYEISDDTLKQWINKFFSLWCRNQWKRERFAPAFHLDDRNLDPKTWCRFPILSGGFEKLI